MEYTKTILIVDDSQMVTKVLSFKIGKAGYNVLSAIDGRKALEFFDGREIDLVITDLNMPNMNGLEFINEIMQNKKGLFYFNKVTVPFICLALPDFIK